MNTPTSLKLSSKYLSPCRTFGLKRKLTPKTPDCLKSILNNNQDCSPLTVPQNENSLPDLNHLKTPNTLNKTIASLRSDTPATNHVSTLKSVENVSNNNVKRVKLSDENDTVLPCPKSNKLKNAKNKRVLINENADKNETVSTGENPPKSHDDKDEQVLINENQSKCKNERVLIYENPDKISNEKSETVSTRKNPPKSNNDNNEIASHNKDKCNENSPKSQDCLKFEGFVMKEDIVELIHKINSKISEVDCLQGNKTYSKKHDLGELSELSKKWRDGLKEIVYAIQKELKLKGQEVPLNVILEGHKIPFEAVGFRDDIMDFD